jgi:hypothetical protein
MKEGLFTVTNLDTKKNHSYRIRKKNKQNNDNKNNNINGGGVDINQKINDLYEKINVLTEQIKKFINK